MQLQRLNRDSNDEHNYCLRCGRRLKTVDARIKGYGPVCEQKMRVENSNRLFLPNLKKDVDKHYIT